MQILFPFRWRLWLWLLAILLFILLLLELSVGLMVVAKGSADPLAMPFVQSDPQATRTFTGNIWQGVPPETTTPLVNVRVTLYGSNNPALWEAELANAVSAIGGAYSLSTDRTYTYYHLVETDPSGYYSTGAQAGAAGMALNYNWIRYQSPTAGNIGGNHFWDRRSNTPTPTYTYTPTPLTQTPTPTYPPYPTYTPTPTRTGTPPNQADLSVSKRQIVPPSHHIPPGSLVTYEITVINNGPATATSVIVSDTLPTGFTFQSAPAGCVRVAQAPPNDIVRCQPGHLPAGQSLSLTIQARVENNACGRVRNRVQVGSSTPDPISSNNDFTLMASVDPCNVPGVLVIKQQTDPPSSSAKLGDVITYALTVVNIGNVELRSVELVESFDNSRIAPLDASPLANEITLSGHESTIRWRDLTGPPPYGFNRPLPPGSQVTVTVRMRAVDLGYVNNCASVTATGGDITVSDSDCNYTRITDPGREFILGKRLFYPTGGVGVVGQMALFMVSLENNGANPIVGIRLRDEYDTMLLTFLSAAYTPDDSIDDGQLDWANLTQPAPRGFGQPLQPRSGRSFSLNIRADAATLPGQPAENCVRAWYWHADQVEHEVPRTCAPLRIVSRSDPQVQIEKTVIEPLGGIANPGDWVRFGFRIINTGPTSFKNIKLVETYDKNCLKFAPQGVSGLDPDNLADDGQLDWAKWLNITSLNPGASVWIGPAVQFQARVGATCNPTTNTLQAVITDTGNKQATASDTETVRIVTEPFSLPDLGDAPTSLNHAGAAMTAYVLSGTPIPAQFPTVYDPGIGALGPMHRQPRAGAWLGDWVTLEQNADQSPDEDGAINIAPPLNWPDRDREDDGVAGLPPLVHCQPAAFVFRVAIPAGAPAQAIYFLNAWFDWDRDGKWGAVADCGVAQTDEWAVQNFALPAGLTPGIHVFTAPAFLPWHPTTRQPLWFRLTLSEQQTDRRDGGGPNGGYAMGETEDYWLPAALVPPNPTATSTPTITPSPTPTVTPSPTPTVTPSPTPTFSPTPTPTVIPAIPLYMPLILRLAQ